MTKYVDSNAAGANDGSSWANAWTSIASVSGAAAGETIYVAHNHNQTPAGSLTAAFPGTATSPNLVLCVNTGTGVLANTAVVAPTGAGTLTVTGFIYCYGIKWTAASTGGAVSGDIVLGSDDVQKFSNCEFKLGGTNGGRFISIGNNADGPLGRAFFDVCGFGFSEDTQVIRAIAGIIEMNGCYAISGTTTPDQGVFTATLSTTGSNVVVNGFDFTNWSSGLPLLATASGMLFGNYTFNNCKMPAGWPTGNGGLCRNDLSGTAGGRAEMYNCDNADTTTKLEVEDQTGSIFSDTSIYQSANDGTASFSWRMVSSARALYPLRVLYTPSIFSKRITDAQAGIAQTITVEIARDGSATPYQNDEVWLEVQYLGNNGFPLGSFVSDAPATVETAPANQESSAVSWTGLGGTNNKMKLSVTFTPQTAGVAICRVCVGVASSTVYVNPVATIAAA